MSSEQPRPELRDSVRRARIEAYREAILDAAERTFAAAGFESAKIEDIAKAAGVAKGTLYNYFANKEAVFVAWAARARTQMIDSLDRALAEAEPAERARALVFGLFNHLQSRARIATVYMQVTGLAMTSALDPAAPQGRVAVAERIRSALAPLGASGRVRAGLTLDQLSLALGGLLGAVIREWLERGAQATLIDQTDFVLALFFDGVRRP